MSWITCLLAGFQVITIGRFWVIPEAAPNLRTSLNHFLLLWGDRIEAAAARVGR